MATATVGYVPPHLMNLLNTHLEAALEARGFNAKAQGAGGLIYFNAVRSLMTDLGMLPEETKDADELASTLMWQTAAVINWLQALACDHEISAQDWVRLAEYPNRLRETAAHLDLLVQQYHEGNQEIAK